MRNPGFGRNTNSVTGVWSSLDRRIASAFLLAGGLLAGSTILKGVEWYTHVTVPGTAIALFALPGLMGSILGLLGISHRLTARAPRLSRATVVVALIAGIAILSTYGWLLVGGLLSTTLGLDVSPTPPPFVLVFLVVTMGIGFGLFGVTIVYSAVPSRLIGRLMLVFAVSWFAIVAAGAVFGPAVPEWVYLLAYGSQPLVLLTTGVALRGDAGATRTESIVDEHTAN